MQELGILIVLIALFLFLALIRPLVKGLWDISGLSWLPLLALGMIVAIFPAYGFRPECIPLLLYVIIVNIIHIPVIVSFLGRLRNDDFLERGVVFTFFAVLFLVFTSGIALYFLPYQDTELNGGAQVVTARDRSRDAELFIRVYPSRDETAAARPVMLVIPPAVGSVTMVDRVCGALSERGFKVLTYSRRGLDSPAVGEDNRSYSLSIGEKFRLLRITALGAKIKRVNDLGRVLEAERVQDIRFLLSYIGQDAGFRTRILGDPDSIFIAGYGAGGDALLSLSDSRNFAAANPRLKGIIAVESRLLSVLEGEPERGPPPEGLGGFALAWTRVKDWFARFRVKKITRTGSLPRPKIPVLFLVSDRIRAPRYRDTRYAPLLRTFHGAERLAILAAAPGAGPLDYSDSPGKYPVYKLFWPGNAKDAEKNVDPADRAASLITNFAVMALGEVRAAPLRQSRLGPDIYREIINFTSEKTEKGF
jgi:dienelactone hydrolase